MCSRAPRASQDDEKRNKMAALHREFVRSLQALSQQSKQLAANDAPHAMLHASHDALRCLFLSPCVLPRYHTTRAVAVGVAANP